MVDLGGNLLELMAREERLCEVLDAYLWHTPSGPIVKSPFVVSFVDVKHAALLNAQHEAKLKAYDEALREHDYDRALMLVERMFRAEFLQEIITEFEVGDRYWPLVGHIWTDSENIHENAELWANLWYSDRYNRHTAMDEIERATLANLPDTFKVHRGYSGVRGTEIGMSWTLDLEKAKWFSRRSGDDPRVISGRVRRDDVLAFFVGRNESEIVVRPEAVYDLTRG